MAQLLNQDPRDLIKRFSPLNQIDHKYHSQLASELRMITVKAGDIIIRKSRNPKLMHFLVSGTAEVRESFENRYNITHQSAECCRALEAALAKQSSVKAVENCTILVTNTDLIDQYLSWSQDFSIYYLDDTDLLVEDTDLIDDDFQEDWDNVFVRSKLAANLSNRAIHQLLSQMEDIEVKAGQVIVKAHTPGDYFYVLKQGSAVVETAATGPFRGQHFELNPGNYFGDEALVADTVRNASVRMTSDGVLGRLDIDAFNHLIKQHLVGPLTDDIKVSASKVQIIDVRFPIEYKQGHLKNSINLPINSLRKNLDELKESLLYVISPANDSRAELATYLMRQAGFDAYQAPLRA